MLTGNHARGYLPHQKFEGAIYFVTFRLANSLPAEVIGRLREQRRLLLARINADPEKARHAGDGQQALWTWYAAEVDTILDRCLGDAWLRQSDIADLVSGALRFFERQRYLLHAWCVMPNHVHAVIEPLGDHTLAAILHSWKSWSGKRANELLGREGQRFWQRESFDHWVRDADEFDRLVRYTLENPVAAGLCKVAGEWRWSGAAVDGGP
ncbi:transposase [Geminisphaera colitermitum]|uniref:transposase n=1 Tax=Geminisphaera colitermitum TaxID=1148786 RepID=UPI0009E02E1B|nr:transposase [Geminisphaera colitermitum]